MKKLWRFVGTLTFWLTFPASWLVLNNSERSRLVMVDNGKLLVVKSWLGTNKWGLPGGGLHKNEKPADSLLREVREELGVGLNPKTLTLILSEPIRIHALRLKLYYFAAEKPANFDIKLQKLEISELAWVPIKALNSKNAGQDVVRAIAAYHQTVG